MMEKRGQGHLPKVVKVEKSVTEHRVCQTLIGPNTSWPVVTSPNRAGVRFPKQRAPTWETSVSVRTLQGFLLPKVTAQP